MRARATAVQHVFQGGTAFCPRSASPLMQPSWTTWLVQLQRKKEKDEKQGTSRTGKVDGRGGKEEEEVQILWGMLCADHAGIVSRSSEGLNRKTTVIVNARSALGLQSPRQKQGSSAGKSKAGESCRSPSIQPARYTNKQSSLCIRRGYPCRQRTLHQNNASSSEGLGILPAVQDGNL